MKPLEASDKEVVLTEETPQMKAKLASSEGKVVVSDFWAAKTIVFIRVSDFWDAKTIVFISHLQKGQTIDGKHYTNLLRQPQNAIEKKRNSYEN